MMRMPTTTAKWVRLKMITFVGRAANRPILLQMRTVLLRSCVRPVLHDTLGARTGPATGPQAFWSSSSLPTAMSTSRSQSGGRCYSGWEQKIGDRASEKCRWRSSSNAPIPGSCSTYLRCWITVGPPPCPAGVNLTERNCDFNPITGTMLIH